MFEFEEKIQNLLDKFSEESLLGIEGNTIKFGNEEKNGSSSLEFDRKFLVDNYMLEKIAEPSFTSKGFVINYENAKDVVGFFSDIGIRATVSKDTEEKIDLGGEERIEISKTLDDKPYFSISRDMFGTYFKDNKEFPIRVTEHWKVKDNVISERMRDISIDV
jgi:hypothetical protein